MRKRSCDLDIERGNHEPNIPSDIGLVSEAMTTIVSGLSSHNSIHIW
jgi:hypothetical protein